MIEAVSVPADVTFAATRSVEAKFNIGQIPGIAFQGRTETVVSRLVKNAFMALKFMKLCLKSKNMSGDIRRRNSIRLRNEKKTSLFLFWDLIKARNQTTNIVGARSRPR